MTAAERAYRLMLRAYPRDFRARYEREMLLAFRELRREPRPGIAGFWAATCLDVARSAPPLRLEALRRSISSFTHTEEDFMMKMTMGIMAIMIGALEAMNAMQEVWGAGIIDHDSRALIGGTMALVAGALIVAAGIALVRRSPDAAVLAQGAAITCAAVFGFLALAIPLMSGFATVLGLGFPILLFAFARWYRPRDPSAPLIA